MHSSDNQLQQLLTGDETASDLKSIADHVEQCGKCQTRLKDLSGEGQWTQDLVGHLQQPGVTESTAVSTVGDGSTFLSRTVFLPRTLLLSHPSDAIEDEVELDPISLDFLDEPTHPELLGRLGRYDIETVIGAGGMGVVLKGFDGDLHRPVAIKVLAPHLAHNAAARRRFAREAQAIAAVIHPHVIPIFNVEVEQKLPYLVMSLIDGPSLQAHVDDHGPLPIDAAIRIAQQTLLGLDAAHSQGLIHRDVKPANILLEGNTLRVVLSDFGLARMVDDASMTRTGIVTGTPHYMSPEQAGGETIDCRSDLFSLGCVMWFMLSGRPPFRAATAMGVLNKICHADQGNLRELNPLVPKPLASIAERLLNKSASDRYQSAQEVEHALSEVLIDWQAGKYLRSERSARLGRRTLVAGVVCLFTVALSAIVGAALGNAWSYWPRQSTPQSSSQIVGNAPQPGPALVPQGLDNNFIQHAPVDPRSNVWMYDSLTQREQAEWRSQLGQLSMDLDRLGASNGPASQWWSMAAAMYRSPESSVGELDATLRALEKETAAWRELKKANDAGPELPEYNRQQ